MFTNTIMHPNLLSETLKSLSIKFSPKFISYTPKQNLNIETSNYILKTASSSYELNELFKLRHRNFLEDVATNTETHDLDKFDHICDHLIIKCKKTDEIIGTYRIICSLYVKKFYSQEEFNLENFLKEDGVKLELGRACIDINHRNGNVIDLLWRGISDYAEKTGAQFLFGCSSVHTIEPQMSVNISNYFSDKNKLKDTYNIAPTKKYMIDDRDCIAGSVFNVKSMIPPLLLSYLTAGAHVHGKPALDREFECIDYMTILDLNNISPLFKKRYFKWLISN